MTDEPLTFKTLRPAGPRKVVLGWAQNAVVVALLMRLARRGGPHWPARVVAGFSVVMIPVAVAFNLALWRNGPHRGRSDPRHEVVIPEHFLGTFTEAEDTPEFREFVARLRSELGLSFADTALALAAIGDRNRNIAAEAPAESA